MGFLPTSYPPVFADIAVAERRLQLDADYVRATRLAQLGPAEHDFHPLARAARTVGTGLLWLGARVHALGAPRRVEAGAPSPR